MSTTRAALPTLPRPARPVTLPGGGVVHVRQLTLAELRRVDELAADAPAGPERDIRAATLLARAALAEPDGSAVFPDAPDAPAGRVAAELAEVERALTPSQIEAVCKAAAGGTPADAKNG